MFIYLILINACHVTADIDDSQTNHSDASFKHHVCNASTLFWFGIFFFFFHLCVYLLKYNMSVCISDRSNKSNSRDA